MPAPPVFRSSSSAFSDTSTGSDTLTIAAPSGVQDGDYLLAFIVAYGDGLNTFVTGPGGWTQAGLGAIGAFAGDLFYKAASSEGASYDFSIFGAIGPYEGVILAYSGADTSSLDALQFDGVPGSTSTNIVAPD